MQRANKANASHAVLIGEDELADGVATLRDLDAGGESKVPLDALARALGGTV